MHTVTLYIPALFWPHAGIEHGAPVIPALRTLLGRGDLDLGICDEGQAWLCGQFGIARQNDWPTASIALSVTGFPAQSGFWLSADPVHLQVNRSQLILLAPESLSVTRSEADALCAALNEHFASDHYTFVAPQPHRWYLGSPRPLRVHTTSLSQVAGREVDGRLPQGEERLVWHRIFNEAQMLLHAHPVNEAREKRGALPVNSLWFSGGGSLPHAQTSYRAVVGSSPLVQGLAKLADIPFTNAQQGASAVAGDQVLIELDAAAIAAMCMDALAWKDALEALERIWFAPMTKLLRKGNIRRIIVATVANGSSHQWSVSRMNLWRLWKPAAMPGSVGLLQ